MTLTDIAGNRLTLHDVCYVPESQDRILSLMKFRREHYADFQFIGLETFVMKAANGFEFSGRAINDILHASLSSQSEVNVAATRSTTAATRNNAKRQQIAEIPSDAEQNDTDSESEIQIAGAAAANDDTTVIPLTCTPRDLWHLRYGHASTTVLRKLDLIKCIISTLANVFHAFVPRKLENRSLHQSQKRKTNWNEYIQISADNFQTLKTIQSIISSSSTNSHDGHTPSISKTSLLPLSKKNL